MTSKYIKKRKKTRKILKGGNIVSKIEVDQMEGILESFQCISSPFCMISKIIKVIYTELKNSVEMVNNILGENGLFLSNVYNFGGESTLKGIIGDVCFDIFDKRICETKINHLLYKDQLPEIPEKQNKKPIQSESLQKGGTINDENITNNAILIKSNNISMDTIDYDKSHIEKYIYYQFQLVEIQPLYNILKYMKVLNDLYEPTIGEIKKPESNPPIFFVTNDKPTNTYEDWKLCSNYEQGKFVTEEVKKKCIVDNRPTMYEQSTIKPTIMNYEPVFTKCFYDIVNVLKEYYTINYDKNNKKNYYFGEKKKIKELEPDLSNELKEVYKVIKFFNIDEQLKMLFKDKLEPLSEKDKDKFFKSLDYQ